MSIPFLEVKINMCEHMYYKDGENYFPYLYCKLDEKRCPFSKRCLKEEKFIPNGDLHKECYKMIENKIKNIPANSYFVQSYRPNRNGKLYLYVVMKDKVEKILSNFTTLNQDYVYLKEGLDGYEVSLTPFKSNTRKIKSEDK